MKTLVIFAFIVAGAHAAEFHVAPTGNAANPGTKAKPFRTIQAAANAAQPGDTVTVHAGIYRERITPPRGGTSEQQRITYQAAPSEKVIITGAEAVKGWSHVTNDTWKVVIPNSFFGDSNPYRTRIGGDWFGHNNRAHHTGSVLLRGHWHDEAATRDAVLKPTGKIPLWFGQAAADQSAGGVIALRLDKPDGELIGSCEVLPTGGWQRWQTFKANIKRTQGKRTLCMVFHRKGETIAATVEKPADTTTIWAQFPGVNPNESDVEIFVRPTVFAPAKTGINYITVRGFTLRNAATQWAPPTAGQVGLVSAYWCKGWIIENNEIKEIKVWPKP